MEQGHHAYPGNVSAQGPSSGNKQCKSVRDVVDFVFSILFEFVFHHVVPLYCRTYYHHHSPQDGSVVLSTQPWRATVLQCPFQPMRAATEAAGRPLWCVHVGDNPCLSCPLNILYVISIPRQPPGNVSPSVVPGGAISSPSYLAVRSFPPAMAVIRTGLLKALWLFLWQAACDCPASLLQPVELGVIKNSCHIGSPRPLD